MAVIRSDTDPKCPFGLLIPQGCKNAGKSVLRMVPMEDPDDLENAEIVDKNRELYKDYAEGEKCPFAREVFEETVQCDFYVDTSDSAPVGSPYYAKHFNSETGPDGLFSAPHGTGALGYYSDTAIPTNNYYGPYSIESISSKKNERKK